MQDPNPPREGKLIAIDTLNWKKKIHKRYGFPHYGNPLNGFKGRRYTTANAYNTAYAIYTFGGATSGAKYRVFINLKSTGDGIELHKDGQWGFDTLNEAKDAAQDFHNEYGGAGICPDDCKPNAARYDITPPSHEEGELSPEDAGEGELPSDKTAE